MVENLRSSKLLHYELLFTSISSLLIVCSYTLVRWILPRSIADIGDEVFSFLIPIQVRGRGRERATGGRKKLRNDSFVG